MRISTTNTTVAAFLANTPLFSINAENLVWTKRTADLSAYPNQMVYLAFRNNSNNKFVLGIDELVVFDCNTINADGGSIDSSTTEACSGFSALNLELEPSYLSSVPTTTISGNTNDVPNWDPLLPGRPFYDGGCCDNASSPYQLVGFEVTVSGTYDIQQVQSGYDGLMFIYTDPLDLTVQVPQIPSGSIAGTTFIAGDDDSAFARPPLRFIH